MIFANPIWALVIFTNPIWAFIIGGVGDQLTSFHTHHWLYYNHSWLPSPTFVSIANPLLTLVIFANPLWALVIFANPLWALVTFTNLQWSLIIGVVGDQLTSFHTHQCCIGTTPSLNHQHWSALLILYWHWWYLLILYEHWWYLLILYEHWWYLPINSEHLSLVLLVTNWHHFILIRVALVQTPTLVSIANPLLALVIFANPLWALVIFANPIWALVRFTNRQWELIIGVVGDQLTSFHTHQCCIGTTPSLNHQHWPALLILYWHCWYLLILYEHWWYLLILYEYWWDLPIIIWALIIGVVGDQLTSFHTHQWLHW